MFEVFQHRQHNPQSGQQGGSGVWSSTFGLTATETDQCVLQFGRGGAGVGLQVPHRCAGHRGHQQPAEDGGAGFLQPMFQLLAVRLEQFELALDAA